MANVREFTSEELLKARKMARNNATAEEIRVALGFTDITTKGFLRKLGTFRIFPMDARKSKRAHNGDQTYLSPRLSRGIE